MSPRLPRFTVHLSIIAELIIELSIIKWSRWAGGGVVLDTLISVENWLGW